MPIEVKAGACVGAGQCALVAPNTFDQDEDGIVVLLQHDPQGIDLKSAIRATQLCPARALAVSAR